MRLELGCPVSCADGAFGKLADVVVDPVTRRITHLVVEPHGDREGARLVPIGHLPYDEAPRDGLALTATLAEAEHFEPLRASSYLRPDEAPAQDPDWDVGIEQAYALPRDSGLDPVGVAPLDIDPHVIDVYDRVPKGEVELRRASAVMTADGHRAGHVDGFVVDRDQQITHVVLQHGHLWGRREVAIPIAAVDRVESDTIVLALSADEVGALEPVRVGRPHGDRRR